MLLFLCFFLLLQLTTALPWGPEDNSRPRPSSISPFARRPDYPDGFSHGVAWPTAPVAPAPPRQTKATWAPPHVLYAYGPDGFFPIYNPTTNSFYKRDGSEVKIPLHEMVEEDGVWIPRHEIMRKRDAGAGTTARAARKMFGFGRSSQPQNTTSIQLDLPAAPIWTPEVIAAALAMIPLVLAVTVLCVILLFILLCCFEPRAKPRLSPERGRPTSKSPARPNPRQAAEHLADLRRAAHDHDLNLAERQFRAFHPPRTDGGNDSAGSAAPAPAPAPSLETVPVEAIHPELILERPRRPGWLARLIHKSTGKPPTPENDVYMRTPSALRRVHPNTSTLLRHATTKLTLHPAAPSTSTLPAAATSSLRARDSTTLRFRTWSRRERWLSDIFNERVPGTENMAVFARGDGFVGSAGPAEAMFSCSEDSHENVALRDGPRRFRLVVSNPDEVDSEHAETAEGYTASAESVAGAPVRRGREGAGAQRLGADASEMVDAAGMVRGVTVSFAEADEVFGSEMTSEEGGSGVLVSSVYSEEEVGGGAEGSALGAECGSEDSEESFDGKSVSDLGSASAV